MPVEDEPVPPTLLPPVPVPLEPTGGVVAVPLPMLLEPVLPLVPDEVCAKAPDMANNAAAVAETMSFIFICVPL